MLPDGKKVLPDDVEPVAAWYSPQTQGKGVDIYIVDEGFGDLQKDNVCTEQAFAFKMARLIDSLTGIGLDASSGAIVAREVRRRT